MPGGFMSLNFHVASRDAAPKPRDLAPPAAAPAFFGEDAETEAFENDEAAARYYLNQELMLDERPAMRALMSPDEPEVTPDLEHTQTQTQKLTDTTVVRFQQSQGGIPVFGSSALVELTDDRQLIAIDAELADPAGLLEIAPVPTLSAAQALAGIAAACEIAAEAIEVTHAPELTLFFDEETEEWHLAYFFQEVPAAPPEAVAAPVEEGMFMMDPAPQALLPLVNYLVDAHSGEVLYYYSAYPTLADAVAAAPPMAALVVCTGVGVDNDRYEFHGRAVANGFALFDPLRNIATYDYEYGNVEEEPAPDRPVQHDRAHFDGPFCAAVSAHVNATRVFNFYKSVLMRDGVDDKGMELVSLVNCYFPSPNSAPPVWRNACWWKKRMWYGQDQDDEGNLRSMARYLDIIAHELTHGVTQFTSDLVYRNQPGALNESFSDIFGVIINNWSLHGLESDVADWTWEIAPGFRGALPLRDFSDPTRVGQPAHMDQYLNTFFDYGGVHTNASIHNKAAYNVLTAVDDGGQRVFKPRDVAILYYLTLTRLPKTANFAKALHTLLDVARTYFGGDPIVMETKLDAIRDAYAAVGIS